MAEVYVCHPNPRHLNYPNQFPFQYQDATAEEEGEFDEEEGEEET